MVVDRYDVVDGVCGTVVVVAGSVDRLDVVIGVSGTVVVAGSVDIGF